MFSPDDLHLFFFLLFSGCSPSFLQMFSRCSPGDLHWRLKASFQLQRWEVSPRLTFISSLLFFFFFLSVCFWGNSAPESISLHLCLSNPSIDTYQICITSCSHEGSSGSGGRLQTQSLGGVWLFEAFCSKRSVDVMTKPSQRRQRRLRKIHTTRCPKNVQNTMSKK